jgi:hypothetical protein
MDAALAGPRPRTALAPTLCALVALAAGIVGALTLAAPESSDRYFSWPLGPPPLASKIAWDDPSLSLRAFVEIA